METLTTAASQSIYHQPSNFDEMSMQQSLLFSDSLKDLKNLRTQLYSAAEYFELSYTHDDQKQIVVDTLKDYALKALVNTVDHLGSVSYKVNDLLDAKVEEVSETEFRVSCIEQRLRTCQEYMDREGFAQQSSIIDTPDSISAKGEHLILSVHVKRVNNPWAISPKIPHDEELSESSCNPTAGDTMKNSNSTKLKGCSFDDEDDWHQFRNAIRATIRETPSSTISDIPNRKGHSPSPSRQSSRLPRTFSFTSTTPKKASDNRTVSPHRFPLLRSGSLATRPITPKPSRPTTPTPAVERQLHYPLMHQKSSSMRVHDEKGNNVKDVERHPSKSKRLLKALLSRRKSKKDDMLYTYLDEY